MTSRTDGLGAINTAFANNILQGGGAAATISGIYTGEVWEGNIIWQTAGAGAIPAGTYDEIDPVLKGSAHGVLRPHPHDSPAINSAVGNHPIVLLDLDGQQRTEPKDRGADEVSTAPKTAKFLTEGDLMRLMNRRDDCE